MEIDPQRLPDEAYRAAVLTALVRDYEVFVTAWDRWPRFRQEAALSTWLFGIAKNKCAQAFRNRVRRQAMAHTFGADIRQQAHATAPESPERLAAEQTQRTRLADSLTQLRDDERLLLKLRYTTGLSVAEIVEIVGKFEAAVRKRLLRR
jgi:RNA polymerase sigma-70 factor (ECF subfamily)